MRWPSDVEFAGGTECLKKLLKGLGEGSEGYSEGMKYRSSMR